MIYALIAAFVVLQILIIWVAVRWSKRGMLDVKPNYDIRPFLYRKVAEGGKRDI